MSRKPMPSGQRPPGGGVPRAGGARPGGGVPRAGGTRPAGGGAPSGLRPSSAGAQAGGATAPKAPASRTPAAASNVSTRTPGKPMMMDKPKEFELPALSMMMAKKAADRPNEWQEKRKRKMIRRNAPPGEDTNKLRQIVKSMRNQEITVHEFVGLVAPSCGDQAACLGNVLAEEMASFRRMCTRVYETMTQDVSDVLANEQVQLSDNCSQRMTIYTDKMMRAIDEIFALIPDFDFEAYYTDPNYLSLKFPLCVAEVGNADEEAALMRQEAFHRYQWLRSEGDRLTQENGRLQDRLNTLKKQQRDEMRQARELEKQNEEKREQLEATEEVLQEQVEELNNSIEKTLVENEMAMMQDLKRHTPKTHDSAWDAKGRKKTADSRSEWNVEVAKEIEERTTDEVAQGEISHISMPAAQLSSSTGAVRKQPVKKKKSKSKFRRLPRPAQDPDAFHYSPPKTPPETAPRPASPFHFSPNREPTERRAPPSPRQGSPSHRRSSPSQDGEPRHTVRMETGTTVVEPDATTASARRQPSQPAYTHHHSTKFW